MCWEPNSSSLKVASTLNLWAMSPAPALHLETTWAYYVAGLGIFEQLMWTIFVTEPRRDSFWMLQWKATPFSLGTTSHDKIKHLNSKKAGQSLICWKKQWKRPPFHSCPQESILSHWTFVGSGGEMEVQQVRTQKWKGSCSDCFCRVTSWELCLWQ